METNKVYFVITYNAKISHMDKSYIKHDDIKNLKTIEEIDHWINKYLEDYHDKEPHHIKWRLDGLRLLWKKRKELTS